MLDFELFKRVVDEAGPSLVRIDFFNYGEAFLHKRAVEMCEYIKRQFPHIYLYTSTNGLAFTEEQVRRLVRSGIDELTFSIDGATAESYVKYRRRGDFDKAIRNLRFAADEKRATGRDVPFINWRYILFNHNDSEGEMLRAREMAAEIGVDRLCWELTDHPEDLFSRRFVPGTRGARAHPARDLGRQQPRQRHPRRHAARRDRGPRTAVAGRPAASCARARAAADAPRPGPATPRHGHSPRRPATAAAWSGSARSSAVRTARWSTATTSAPGCRRRSDRATVPTSRSRSPRRHSPAAIRLKFDMVSEGIDWFEACGSPTTTKTLVVI